MAEAKCAIWGTSAETLEKVGDYEVFDSPRAGGKYWISGSAHQIVGSASEEFKIKLTTWLCQQRWAGVIMPKITADIVPFINSRKLLPVAARFEPALLFLGRQLSSLGEQFYVDNSNDPDTQMGMAETECKDDGELYKLFELLNSTGLVLVEGSFVSLSASGWERIAELTAVGSDSAQVFVAMWFDESMDEVYESAIKPAIEHLGYNALRIDKKHHNNKIDDEIIAELRRSRFVVADFTCEPEKARGGVYYEAGFAHGLGLQVIWTCRDDVMKYVHFDTRQYAHIVWKTPADLFEQLKNRIGATVGDGPLPKWKL